MFTGGGVLTHGHSGFPQNRWSFPTCRAEFPSFRPQPMAPEKTRVSGAESTWELGGESGEFGGLWLPGSFNLCLLAWLAGCLMAACLVGLGRGASITKVQTCTWGFAINRDLAPASGRWSISSARSKTGLWPKCTSQHFAKGTCHSVDKSWHHLRPM